MTPKPQIQYVGQFYVHGSEARAIQEKQRKAKTKLPKEHRVRVEKIYVDPAALAGIAVSIFLLSVMVMGALRMHTDWQNYQRMKDHLADLKQENMMLNYRYHNCFDKEELYTKAVGLGLVPVDSVQHISVTVTAPEPESERTWLDDLKWFLDGLLE